MKIEMKPTSQIIESHGLGKHGEVQSFFTATFMRRMQRYMPYLTGTTIKMMIAQTDISSGRIVVQEPQARYLYYGKIMVNAKTGKGPMNIPGVGPRYKKGTMLKATDRDLNYTKTKNPLAGPFWDKRTWAAEGDVITRELQNYVNRSK